ncbi:hypothetical protein VNO78_32508 [Psophocarpus tetragonolobus]|uniref:Uncharacterized protein n=1 Tax=Psophocarpus tetragonolobus TaxID=3891 RepID=A0AAN9RS38_PSOTE
MRRRSLKRLPQSRAWPPQWRLVHGEDFYVIISLPELIGIILDQLLHTVKAFGNRNRNWLLHAGVGFEGVKNGV